MKKSELKQLIREEISSLAQRDYPAEQNAVVKQYLNKLKNLELENTDDLDDLKNLSIALELYNKELILRIKTQA